MDLLERLGLLLGVWLAALMGLAGPRLALAEP
jgi:hypothetical protein